MLTLGDCIVLLILLAPWWHLCDVVIWHYFGSE